MVETGTSTHVVDGLTANGSDVPVAVARVGGGALIEPPEPEPDGDPELEHPQMLAASTSPNPIIRTRIDHPPLADVSEPRAPQPAAPDGLRRPHGPGSSRERATPAPLDLPTCGADA